MALKATVERRSGQVRNGGLEGIKAVIQRKKGVLAKGNDGGLLFEGKDRGMRSLGTWPTIRNRGAFLPFGHGLLIDTVPFGQSPQALDHFVLLDGSPPSSWRCHEEFVP